MPTLSCRLACLPLAALVALVAPARAWAQERPPPPSPPASITPAQRVMTLAEVERVALEQQPQMLVARAATNIARAQSDQARAPLLPQVIGSAAYTRETGNYAPRPGAIPTTLGVAGGSLFSQSYDYWQFGLSATQLIYDFGQTSEKLRAADYTVDAQRASEQVARLGVVLNVRKAYFNARAMKELVDVAKETLDDQNKHLVQVQGMVTVGTQPQIALAQQKAAVANAVVQLITAQNNYETSKAQLNQAAGMVGGTDYDVGDEQVSPPEDEDQSLDSLMAKAIAARPEIATFDKQRESQEATLSAAKGGYGPTLSASAGMS